MHQAQTVGYVGSVEVETEGDDRVWFALTQQDNNADWLERNGVRAWFQMWMEPTSSRAVHSAKLAMLFEAMREGYQVIVSHPEEARDDIWWASRGDTYDAIKVRTLRTGIYT
jgi:hypothetical protein